MAVLSNVQTISPNDGQVDTFQPTRQFKQPDHSFVNQWVTNLAGGSACRGPWIGRVQEPFDSVCLAVNAQLVSSGKDL